MASSRKSRFSNLVERVSDCLTRHRLAAPTRLCVGLSGGLDSVVLLHLLVQLRESHGYLLSAVHIHHGLSVHADAWADAAVAVAESLSVSCRVERVSVDRRAGGVEAAARAARYAVFERVDADALCVAHHQNDQAETVLLNALRGNGLAGLAAMPESRALPGGLPLLRPLLDVPRSVLVEYAEAQGLSWVDDDSNDDERFTRNFLRHAILPRLVLRDPGVPASLARLAAHAAEAAALLGELAEQDLGVCVLGDGFDLAEAARLGVRRSRNALRHWLNAQGIVVDARAFEVFINQLDSPDDAQPQLRWRGETIRRYRGRLYRVVAAGGGLVTDVVPGEPLAPEIGGGRLIWQSASDGVSRDKARTGCWQLRPRRGGERLRLHVDGPNRSLKLLYQEAGVPPWLRESTPLLYCDDVLVAVPGIGVAAEFRGEGWLPLWQPV